VTRDQKLAVMGLRYIGLPESGCSMSGLGRSTRRKIMETSHRLKRAQILLAADAGVRVVHLMRWEPALVLFCW
jgi:hypothetical protein